MQDVKIMGHSGRSEYQPINIKNIEKQHGASFVGDFCVKTKDSEWTDHPIAIFYQPTPNVEAGHSHYFGIFENEFGILMITKGDSAFSEPIVGVVSDDGEVIFSRSRHNYRESKDGSVSIDGGRDYTHCVGDSDRLVNLIIEKDHLIISPDIING